MKKAAMFIMTAVFTAVSFFITSCGVDSGDVLWYQRYPLSVEVATEDASFIITVDGNSLIKAEVTSPVELAGVSFVFGENDAIISGDTEIPINRSSVAKVFAIASAFVLDNDSIVSVDTDGEMSLVTFKNDTASYVFSYNRDGIPVSFVCKSGGNEVKADIVKITPAPEKSGDKSLSESSATRTDG